MPLIIVPTPIGNLEDMTLRGLRALREADVIACEDTRHTLGLLNYYEIKKPLISCHEYNEAERVETIMKWLERGETVALVSDAGTPGLSDPGVVIIQAAVARGLPFDALPGATALVPAMLLAGMGMESFYFVGFLKGTLGEKTDRLKEVKEIRDLLVFFTAPHHLMKDIALMGSVLGDRKVSLVREISKIHQETIKGTLKTLAETMPEEKIRGEFVCVVEGNSADEEPVDDSIWQEEARQLFEAGDSAKNVANLLSIKYRIPKNRIKRHIIEQCAEEDKL